MAENNTNPCCKCTTPQYTIQLNTQGPPGKQGIQGIPGVSPVVTVAVQTDTTYRLNITDANGTIETPNLQGRGVPRGGEVGSILTKTGEGDFDCTWQAAFDAMPLATATTPGIVQPDNVTTTVTGGVMSAHLAVNFEDPLKVSYEYYNVPDFITIDGDIMGGNNNMANDTYLYPYSRSVGSAGNDATPLYWGANLTADYTGMMITPSSGKGYLIVRDFTSGDSVTTPLTMADGSQPYDMCVVFGTYSATAGTFTPKLAYIPIRSVGFSTLDGDNITLIETNALYSISGNLNTVANYTLLSRNTASIGGTYTYNTIKISSVDEGVQVILAGPGQDNKYIELDTSFQALNLNAVILNFFGKATTEPDAPITNLSAAIHKGDLYITNNIGETVWENSYGTANTTVSFDLGNGLTLDDNGKLIANIDNDTITFNSAGQMVAQGGGSSASLVDVVDPLGYITGTADINGYISNKGYFFTNVANAYNQSSGALPKFPFTPSFISQGSVRYMTLSSNTMFGMPAPRINQSGYIEASNNFKKITLNAPVSITIPHTLLSMSKIVVESYTSPLGGINTVNPTQPSFCAVTTQTPTLLSNGTYGLPVEEYTIDTTGESNLGTLISHEFQVNGNTVTYIRHYQNKSLQTQATLLKNANNVLLCLPAVASQEQADSAPSNYILAEGSGLLVDGEPYTFTVTGTAVPNTLILKYYSDLLNTINGLQVNIDNQTIKRNTLGQLYAVSGGGSGTSDYTQLTNLPQINSITLTGNKTATDLQLAGASEVEELGNELNQLGGDVTNLENSLALKQDKLTAGTGITISDDNVISATGGGTGGTTNYNDLSNKPQIAGVELSGNKTLADLGIQPEGEYLTESDLSGYAKTSDLPTATSDLTNDSGFITNSVNNLTNYTLSSELATVATTGSYNDLENKPTIPEEYTLPTATTTTLGGVKVDGSTITIADGVITAHAGGTGSTDYTTLTNKPQINSVELTGNKTLTELGIQAAGDYALVSELDEYLTIDDAIAEYVAKDNLPKATTSAIGCIKPDGSTITISEDGTISATSTSSGDVTSNGNNTFSGTNTFTNTVALSGSNAILTIGTQGQISGTDEGIDIHMETGHIVLDGSTMVADDLVTSGNLRIADGMTDGEVILGDGNGLTTIYSSSDINAVINGSTSTTLVTAIELQAVSDELSSTTDEVQALDTAFDQLTANLGGLKFWKGTSAEYEAITSKDTSTLYVISDSVEAEYLLPDLSNLPTTSKETITGFFAPSTKIENLGAIPDSQLLTAPADGYYCYKATTPSGGVSYVSFLVPEYQSGSDSFLVYSQILQNNQTYGDIIPVRKGQQYEIHKGGTTSGGTYNYFFIYAQGEEPEETT